MAACRIQESKMKARRSVNCMHVFGMHDDLWDKVRGVGSETWRRCE